MNSVRPSFTALRQFEDCERKFFYRFVLGIQEEPGPQMAIGIAYHCAIELIQRGSGLDLIGERAIALAKTNKGWSNPGVTEVELAAEIDANMKRLAPTLAALPPHVDAEGKPQVEVWCTKRTGKIDEVCAGTPVVEEGNRIIRLDPGICVIDYKSVGFTKSRFKKDHSMQLAHYCLDTGATAGAIVSVPRDLRQDISIEVYQFTADELARWDKYLTAQFGAMASRGQDESQYKLATRGFPLCSPRWCQFWDRCPGGAGK